MIQIGLKVNGENFRKTKSKFGQVIDGKCRALDRRLKYYRRELPLEAARSFRAYLEEIIILQDESYMGGYAPLTFEYAYQKGTDAFWVASESTLDAFGSSDVEEISNTANYTAFTLGLDSRTQKIIHFMEGGTVNMPSRPLLAPAFRRFSISFYRQTGTYMRDLVKVWRGA